MNPMHRPFRAGIVLLFLTFLATSRMIAWGTFGHETIALIAWSRLTLHEQEQLDQIFAAAPEIYEGRSGLKAMFFAATWPDQLREEHFGNAGIIVPLSIFDEVGIHDSAHADQLHFVDYDAGGRATCPNNHCAVVAIQLSLRALSNPHSTPRQKAEALPFLVHVVGDIHQPLHCGDRSDLGGNKISIKTVGKARNLHALWDSGLFARTKVTEPADYIQKYLDPLIVANESEAQTLDPENIADESHHLAEAVAYVDDDGNRIEPGALLSDAYLDRAQRVADEQLAKAGIRLGLLLKQALQNN